MVFGHMIFVAGRQPMLGVFGSRVMSSECGSWVEYCCHLEMIVKISDCKRMDWVNSKKLHSNALVLKGHPSSNPACLPYLLCN
jgi:hypothetical protein